MRNGSLVQRDRDIFLRHIEPTLATTATGQNSGRLLHLWLEHRRRTEFGARGSLSPGALFHRGPPDPEAGHPGSPVCFSAR